MFAPARISPARNGSAPTDVIGKKGFFLTVNFRFFMGKTDAGNADAVVVIYPAYRQKAVFFNNKFYFFQNIKCASTTRADSSTSVKLMTFAWPGMRPGNIIPHSIKQTPSPLVYSSNPIDASSRGSSNL